MNVLFDPSEFSTTLKDKIKTSNEIILSALYIGSDKEALELIDCLISRLSDQTKPTPKITIILDYSRTLRIPTNVSITFQKLLNNYSSNKSIYLFKMPQSSSYLSHNINEILGVYHNKYYLFDNTVILSGANLSCEYLTNRQDRYILFDVNKSQNSITANLSNNTDLITWLKAYTMVVIKYCYQLRPDLSITKPEVTDMTNLTTELNHLLYTTSSPPQPVVIPYTLPYTPKCANSSNDNSIENQSAQPATTVYLVPLVQFAPIGIQQESTSLTAYFNNLFGHNSDPSAASGYKVDVTLSSPYPSYPDELLHALVAHRSPTTTTATTVTTADTTGSKGGGMSVAYSFLTAAPHTHGFHRGYGLKSLVPLLHADAFNQAYTAFINKLYSTFSKPTNTTESHKSSSNTNTTNTGYHESVSVRSLQYSRPGWTFHAKGVWVFTKPLTARDKRPQSCTYNITPEQSYIASVEADMNAIRAYLKPVPSPTPPPLPLTQSLPQPFSTVTYIGSSNLGTRSRLRDYELGILLFSRDCKVQRVYRQELRYLLSHSSPTATTTTTTTSTTNTHTGSREGSESVVRISSSDMRPKPEIKRIPSSGDRLVRVLSRLVRSFL